MTAAKLKRVAMTVLAASTAVMAVTHFAAFLMHRFEWYSSVLFSVLYVFAFGTVLLAAASVCVLSFLIVSSAISRVQQTRN